MIINGTLWYPCVSWSSHCGIFYTYPLFRSQTALGVLSVDTVSLSLYGLFCLHAVILHEIFLPFTTKNLLLHELKKNSFTKLSRNSSLFWKIQTLSFLCTVDLTPAWRLLCPVGRSWRATWFQSPAQNFARTHLEDRSGKHLLFTQPLMNFSLPVISLPATGKTSRRVTPCFNRQRLKCPVTRGRPLRDLVAGTLYGAQTLRAEYAQPGSINLLFWS